MLTFFMSAVQFEHINFYKSFMFDIAWFHYRDGQCELVIILTNNVEFTITTLTWLIVYCEMNMAKYDFMVVGTCTCTKAVLFNSFFACCVNCNINYCNSLQNLYLFCFEFDRKSVVLTASKVGFIVNCQTYKESVELLECLHVPYVVIHGSQPYLPLLSHSLDVWPTPLQCSLQQSVNHN